MEDSKRLCESLLKIRMMEISHLDVPLEHETEGRSEEVTSSFVENNEEVTSSFVENSEEVTSSFVGSSEEVTSSLVENVGHENNFVDTKSHSFQHENVLKEELVDDPDEVIVNDGATSQREEQNICDESFLMVQDSIVKDEHPQLCDDSDSYFNMEKDKKAKTFQCEHCSWVCNSLSNLKKHRMIHTGERPHTCSECNKTFRQIHHLKDHIRTHTGERPFMCNECGSTFAQRSSLNVHKRKHTGIKPHVCKICDHATYEKEHMVIHMRTHTGERPYQCDECGQTFSTMTRLKFHIMIHTGERRYTCEECGARFREKATLQKHRGVHLARGPFPCKVCGKEFPRLASLSLHRKIHEQQVYPLPENRINSDIVQPTVGTGSNQQYIGASKGLEDFAKKEEILNTSCIYESIPQGESEQLPNSENKQMYLNDMEEIPMESNKVTPVYPDRQENIILETTAINPSFCCNETVVHTETESRSIISIAHPDHVQRALETGTVWETHQQNGEELLVIIPPSLADREITLVSNRNGTDSDNSASGFSHSEQQAFHVQQNQADMVQDYPPIIQEEIHEKVQQNHPHILQEETSNGVQSYPMVLQEEIHEDNTGLLVWDDGLDPVTEVTYVIEEGAQNPIMIQQDETHFVSGSEVPEMTRKRRKTKEIWLMEGGEKHVERVKKPRAETGGSVIVRTKKKRQIEKKVRVRKDYTCKQCGKACKTASNFNTHMRMHTGERPYFCGICGCGFKQIPHLRSHIRTHTGEKPYKCTNCNASFTQTSRLNIHKKKCKKDAPYIPKKPKVESACKVRNFYCKICDKTFIDECFKKEHMKTHLEANLFTCEICGLTYKNKASIEKHKLLHSKDKCICEMCGGSFNSQASLNFHKLTYHKVNEEENAASGMVISVKIGEEKDFVVINPSIKSVQTDGATECQIKTEAIEISEADNYSVKREVIHITDADGTVKSEVVTGINEDYTQFSDLPEPDVAKPIGESKLKTEEPDSLATDTTELEQQFSKPTDSINDESSSGKYKTMIDEQGRKTFVCKICDKGFLQSSNLLSHMRMHTGERPYKCNLCSLAFRQITHLKDHMHTHTGVRAFKCGVCEMSFSQRSAARRHIKTVHDPNADVIKVGNVYSVRETVTENSSDSALATDESNHNNKTKEKIYKTSEKGFEKCEKCDKTYPTSYMKIHMRCHSGERPYSCNVCNQSFKQRSHLLSHRLRHTGEKPYVCKICNASYTHSYRLRVHLKKCKKKGNNSEKIENIEELNGVEIDINKDFACECGVIFKREILLTNHRRKCSLSMNADCDVGESNIRIPEKVDMEDDNKAKSEIHSKGKKGNQQHQVKQYVDDEKITGIKETRPSQYKDLVSEKRGSDCTNICDECGMAFRRASALSFHQKMIHNKSSDVWTYGYGEESLVKQEIVEDEYPLGNTDQSCINIKTEVLRLPEKSSNRTKRIDPKENSEVFDVKILPEEMWHPLQEYKATTKQKNVTRGKSNVLTNLPVQSKEEHVKSRRLKEQKCLACSKMFKNMKELNLHLKTCQDIASESRKDTQETMDQNTNTNDKISNDVQASVETRYPCNLCGQTFTRSSKLKHHLNMWCKGMKRESNLQDL